MSQSSNIGPPLQDPLTMAARRLGEAKTNAATRGVSMLDAFEQIKKETDALKGHGLSVTTVEFENKAIQAAWREYTKADCLVLEMPLMETEGALVRRIHEQR